jgi:hypothetical protein
MNSSQTITVSGSPADYVYSTNGMGSSTVNSGQITTSSITGLNSSIWTDAGSTNASITVDGTFEVQGRDVLSELDEMRDVLMLLKRDVDMEAKYPKLKELKDAYAAQLAKYKTFDIMKESA